MIHLLQRKEIIIIVVVIVVGVVVGGGVVLDYFVLKCVSNILSPLMVLNQTKHYNTVQYSNNQ